MQDQNKNTQSGNRPDSATQYENAKQGQTDSASNTPLKGDNTIKDPANWVTGDEPITGAQQSYLQTLASEAGEEVDTEISKAEASIKIDELQEKTGRGK